MLPNILLICICPETKRRPAPPSAKAKELNHPPNYNNFKQRHTLAFLYSTFDPMIRNSTIMETQTIYPTAFQSNKIELENTSSKINLGEVFAVRKGSYLNEFNLFIAHFNSIPNFIHEINIDCKKANRWFANNYKSEIKDFYFNKRYYNGSKCAEYDHLFYILFDDLIVDFDTNNSVVRF